MKRFLILVFLSPVLVIAQKNYLLPENSGLKEASVVSLVDINKPADTLGKAG